MRIYCSRTIDLYDSQYIQKFLSYPLPGDLNTNNDRKYVFKGGQLFWVSIQNFHSFNILWHLNNLIHEFKVLYFYFIFIHLISTPFYWHRDKRRLCKCCFHTDIHVIMYIHLYAKLKRFIQKYPHTTFLCEDFIFMSPTGK